MFGELSYEGSLNCSRAQRERLLWYCGQVSIFCSSGLGGVMNVYVWMLKLLFKLFVFFQKSFCHSKNEIWSIHQWPEVQPTQGLWCSIEYHLQINVLWFIVARDLSLVPQKGWELIVTYICSFLPLKFGVVVLVS